MNSLPLLIVRCADLWLALPIGDVLEVVRMVAPASPLPRVPRYCIGAIDYHGQLVPMIDLAARLGRCPPRRPSELIDARIVLLTQQMELFLDGESPGTEDVASAAADVEPDADPLAMPLSMLALVVDDVSELCEREIIPMSAADEGGNAGLWRGSVQWQEQKSALVFDVPVQQIVTMRASRALRQALQAAARQGRDILAADGVQESLR
ncbi:MAG TPA: chemotaxis protein CheW [Pseudomonadota bacterium]|nr:chemotaxis protein CheW [Pseudomonadota bacterium]